MASAARAPLTRAQRSALLRGIYAIVDDRARDPVGIARAALNAGIRVVQYRAKRGIRTDVLIALRDATTARDALLLLNDDARAAAAWGCDGVHLGPGDEGFDDPRLARGGDAEMLVGLSCATPAEARAAQRSGADYAGAGSIFATASKADAGDPIGLDGLRAVARATALPVVAIGGISVERIAGLAAAGAAMAAVISAIAGAADPGAAAVDLVRAWDRAAG